MGILAPLSQLLSSIVRLRNFTFSRGFRQINKLPVPVVSVGNITVGGTGKTPIILHLLAWSLGQNKQPGVISRGYKGKFNGPHRVDLSTTENAPRYFGDEPTMIAANYPSVPVFVCPNRFEAGEALLAEDPVDIIFADDAFQHRQLYRDLDIVVIDALEPLKNYRVLPDGRGREPVIGLRRADFIILNKINMVSAKEKASVREFIKMVTSEQVPIAECGYQLSDICHIGDGQKRNVPEGTKCLLVSGVGRPESFEKLLADESIEAVHHMSYEDHYEYKNHDIQEILRRMRKYGADIVLMTEKDAVKISNLTEEKVFCFAKLELKFSKEISRLYEKISFKNS